ncbi:hypothetical protein QUF76_05750 [Desulfobacterales bacterium HSG16]|nr:hypothetical protein [Desulfobacterales bacterium HSG16]
MARLSSPDSAIKKIETLYKKIDQVYETVDLIKAIERKTDFCRERISRHEKTFNSRSREITAIKSAYERDAQKLGRRVLTSDKELKTRFEKLDQKTRDLAVMVHSFHDHEARIDALMKKTDAKVSAIPAFTRDVEEKTSEFQNKLQQRIDQNLYESSEKLAELKKDITQFTETGKTELSDLSNRAYEQIEQGFAKQAKKIHRFIDERFKQIDNTIAQQQEKNEQTFKSMGQKLFQKFDELTQKQAEDFKQLKKDLNEKHDQQTGQTQLSITCHMDHTDQIINEKWHEFSQFTGHLKQDINDRFEGFNDAFSMQQEDNKQTLRQIKEESARQISARFNEQAETIEGIEADLNSRSKAQTENMQLAISQGLEYADKTVAEKIKEIAGFKEEMKNASGELMKNLEEEFNEEKARMNLVIDGCEERKKDFENASIQSLHDVDLVKEDIRELRDNTEQSLISQADEWSKKQNRLEDDLKNKFVSEVDNRVAEILPGIQKLENESESNISGIEKIKELIGQLKNNTELEIISQADEWSKRQNRLEDDLKNQFTSEVDNRVSEILPAIQKLENESESSISGIEQIKELIDQLKNNTELQIISQTDEWSKRQNRLEDDLKNQFSSQIDNRVSEIVSAIQKLENDSESSISGIEQIKELINQLRDNTEQKMSSQADEWSTRHDQSLDDLKKQLGDEFKTGLKNDINDLRTELTSEVDNKTAEITGSIQKLENETASAKTGFDDAIEECRKESKNLRADIETTIQQILQEMDSASNDAIDEGKIVSENEINKKIKKLHITIGKMEETRMEKDAVIVNYIRTLVKGQKVLDEKYQNLKKRK